jgi:alanine-synthesizing transaminase
MFSKRTNWKLNPNKYTRALEEMRATGAPIVDLTVSNPTLCGFQYDAGNILKAFQNPNGLSYEPEAKGLLGARGEVARYYKEDHGITVDPESLLLATSTSEAYSYLFRLLCDPHDEILVPKPSYPLFDFLGELQDVSLVPYSLEYAHGWFVDFPSLVRAVTSRTRAVLLVHPNNPTGSFVHREERQRFNELCRERGLSLVVDEVFLDYRVTDESWESFATNKEALTFTLSGLSKVAALPQMKVAWLITSGPEAAKKMALERLEIIADTYLSLNAPTQWAFGALLELRRAMRPQLLERIRQNWEFLRSSVGKEGGCELLDTEGGWCGVIRVKSGRSDEELAIEILQSAHTLVHPGHFYDFRTEGYLVVSLITPVSDFRQGIGCLLKFLAGVRA